MTIGHPHQGGRFFAAVMSSRHTVLMRRAFFLLLYVLSLAQAAPLRLAFDTLEPWKRYDEQGKATGAYVEIARELARRIGTPLEIVDCPLKRCLAMLQHGDADIFIGLDATPERERYLRFLSTPYRMHVSDRVFYMRGADTSRLRNAGDLANLRIGAKLGSELAEKLAAREGLRIEVVPDPRSNFAKLQADRIDVVAIPEDQGEYLLATLHLQGRVAKAPYREMDGSPRSVAIARVSPFATQFDQIDAAMTAMRADGTLRRIYQTQYYDRFGISPQAISIE
jgi:polar amino acid transport system substrate-binding protein